MTGSIDTMPEELQKRDREREAKVEALPDDQLAVLVQEYLDSEWGNGGAKMEELATELQIDIDGTAQMVIRRVLGRFVEENSHV